MAARLLQASLPWLPGVPRPLSFTGIGDTPGVKCRK